MLTNGIISNEPRYKLCKLGRKEQTYDDIINELIQKNEALNPSSVGSAEPTKYGGI
ncbi:MAG TPA: hypothetical protein VFG45_09820 [Candidatus Nitrosocosmicus sp.]|nr:hypothetical protein [Candidatus Nitrosocosmicus sp.]